MRLNWQILISIFAALAGGAALLPALALAQSSSLTVSAGLPSGSVGPSALDRAYLETNGGTLTGPLTLLGGLSVGTTQLVTSTAGRIGVGTASPENELSLSEGMNIDQANANSGSCSSSDTSCLKFGSDSGNAIASKRTAGGNQFGLDFYFDSVARLQLSQRGNLSLNLSSSAPIDSGIQVNGSSQDMGLKLINSGTSGSSWYVDSTSSGSGYGAGSLAITLSGGTPTLVLTSGNPGSVGIGTNSPQATLDVNGIVRFAAQAQGASPTCDANHEGELTYTYQYVLCVCTDTPDWVELSDGGTACPF